MNAKAKAAVKEKRDSKITSCALHNSREKNRFSESGQENEHPRCNITIVFGIMWTTNAITWSRNSLDVIVDDNIIGNGAINGGTSSFASYTVAISLGLLILNFFVVREYRASIVAASNVGCNLVSMRNPLRCLECCFDDDINRSRRVWGKLQLITKMLFIKNI